MAYFITKILLICFVIAMVPAESHSSSHCNLDVIRHFAMNACEELSELGSHVYKRQINRHGYQIENIKVRTQENRSFLIGKKITSSRFPRGAYLLVHYPFARHLFSSSRNNEIVEHSSSNTFDLIMQKSSDNDISNDIVPSRKNVLSNDVNSSSNSKENVNLKNKYSMKRYRRNASDNEVTVVEGCCGEKINNCLKYFCSH